MTFPISPESGFTAHAANLAMSGKINSTGTLTLPNSGVTTTTVITNYFLSPSSAVFFDPTTLNAATELFGGTMYTLTANRGDGVWTVTHAATAVADRIFKYVILG